MPVTHRVNAKSTALADAELCHHDVIFPLGNFSDRLDVTKETKCAFSASHSLLKFPGILRLIVRLLIPGKGKTLSLQRGLGDPTPLAKRSTACRAPANCVDMREAQTEFQATHHLAQGC